MKWIKSRNQYLNEAKIRDVILPRQAKQVAKKWGEKYLDYEEIEPTDKIKQGKWKLEEEDKNKVLSAFFECDMENVFSIFNNLPDRFVQFINKSIDSSIIGNENYKSIVGDNFDIRTPTIDQMIILYESIFRKPDINATKGSEMIQRDENGRPVRDEEGNMIKVQKEAGDPIFSNNLININSMVQDYNRCYDDERISNPFDDRDLNSLRNLGSEHHNDYKADFEIFNKDLYLSISHNPKDILNMSISRFYASCQHLYSDSGYNRHLLSNVFDPNSIPAFLLFDTPLFWEDEKIADFLPLTRMIVRNMETFDESSSEAPKIFFDRAYPDRMKEVFGEILEKYSGNKETASTRDTYYYMPDIDPSDKDNISDPYMDRLGIKKVPYIGVNTKSLFLNRSYDWSNVKISPKAKIKELVIETPDLPENLLEIDIQLEWIKFKYLSLNTLENFDKIKSDSFAFDKCKFDSDVLSDISKSNENIKKLQIISCDANNFDLSSFRNLEELHLIYTLDSLEELSKTIETLNLSKLVISGDLVSGKDGKAFTNELKRKMKVEIVGPVI
jgi:hypothetical protein